MTSTRGNCLRAPFSPVPDFPSELAHVFVDAAVILRSWVVLKNSDIVSADLAAAAVSGGQRLGSSTIPSWYESVCGCSVVGWIPVNCDQFPSIYFFYVHSVFLFSQGAVGCWRRGVHGRAILQQS